jgi:hypothetical protein
MFSSILTAYNYAVSTTRQITPAAGMHVVNDMLNSGDGTYITAFVPHDEALTTFRLNNIDRYDIMLNGGDAQLLQKVRFKM